MSNPEDFSDDIVNGGFGSEEQHRMSGGGDDMYGNGGGDMHCGPGDDSMGHGGDGADSGDHGYGGYQGHYNQGGHGDAPGPGKDDDRKLFIGGLSWETTEKDLREYFSQFGGIESLTLKTDPASGRSRGFAFIVFNDTATLDKVIAAGEHIINGKKIDPKKAKARTGKVFVGGLIQEITDDDIKSYFSQFGNVIELEMPIDKLKNQRKGFCFVTFDNEQVVHELLKSPKQKICGKEVDVKKAQPSQASRGMMGWNAMGAPMRGSRGAPRGSGGRGSSRGRSDWYYGAPSGGYGASTGGYYDYYGGGYGSSGYGGYDYGNYGGYDTSYGYDTTGYETTQSSRGGGVGTTRGRGIGGVAGKQRGGTPRGFQRHVPY